MTPAEQAAQKRERPFSVRRRQRDGRQVLQVSSTDSEMEALRARIRGQSRVVAEHITSDGEAHAFLEDWTMAEPLTR